MRIKLLLSLNNVTNNKIYIMMLWELKMMRVPRWPLLWMENDVLKIKLSMFEKTEFWLNNNAKIMRWGFRIINKQQKKFAAIFVRPNFVLNIQQFK